MTVPPKELLPFNVSVPPFWTAMFLVPPVSLIFPPTTRLLFVARLKVRLPFSSRSRLIVCVGLPVAPVVVTLPPSVIRLPDNVNDPAVLELLNVIPLNCVSAAMLLLLLV